MVQAKCMWKGTLLRLVVKTFIISTWIYLGSWTGREICEMVLKSTIQISGSGVFSSIDPQIVEFLWATDSPLQCVLWSDDLPWCDLRRSSQIQQHVPRDPENTVIGCTTLPRDDVYCLASNRTWSYDKERLDRSLRPSNGSACTMRSHWPWQCSRWELPTTIFWAHFEANLNVTIFNSPCWLIPFKVWLISYQLIVKSYDLSVKNATS